ncbi:uncharacterized protein LOC136027642 [Artemia franciscana]|uniref:uncharacterized protein LOC136027642 n=1 Tax=Artemia franciscana TaxID=6661 RepID=UPI0032DACF6D
MLHPHHNRHPQFLNKFSLCPSHSHLYLLLHLYHNHNRRNILDEFQMALKDDDVAVVHNGALSIHKLKGGLEDTPAREITTLKIEIQKIMKGLKQKKKPAAHSSQGCFCKAFSEE